MKKAKERENNAKVSKNADERIKGIIQKNEELCKEKESKEKEMQKEKSETIEQLTELNDKIKQSNQTINELKQENISLIKRLKEIKNEIDSKVTSVKSTQFNVNETKIESLSTSINTANKMLKNIEKTKRLFQKEIEMKKNEIDKYINSTNLSYKTLLDKYTSINKVLQEKESELNSLKSIANYHKEYCHKDQLEKENQLKMLHDEYEKTLKDINLLRNKTIKEIPYSPKKKMVLSSSPSFTSYKKKRRLVTSLQPIWNQLDHSRKNTNTEINQSEVLFRNNEKELIRKIIPTEIVNKYEEKYNSVDLSVSSIKHKMKRNFSKLKTEIESNKGKVDLYDNQLRRQNKQMISLKKISIEQKRQIAEITSRVRQIKKDLKFYTNLIAFKTKENEKLTTHLNDILTKTNNGELKEKKVNKE